LKDKTSVAIQCRW